jgi:hypothetical protein
MKNAQSPAGTGSAPAGLARGRTALGAVAVAGIALAAVAGCSSGSPGPSASAPKATAPATTPAARAATTSASAPPVTPPPATPSPSADAAVPTLGQLAGVFARGTGFGQVKPAKIFNGGDPTGLVTHVVWSSWGGARAVATGTSDYVGPNQSVAQGTEESATVVAFDLGNCDGKLMYQAVEWYFPQHGQAFNPNQYENICTGTYVGQ